MTEKNVIQLLEHMGRCYRRSYAQMNSARVQDIRTLLVQELNKSGEGAAQQSVPLWTTVVQMFQVKTLRPVFAVLIVGVLSISSLLSVAEASLPGDSLYTIKLVRERAEIRLKKDGTDRNAFAAGLTKKRAEEMQAVVLSDETKELKSVRLKVAVAGLQSSVNEMTDAMTRTSEKKEFATAVEQGTADAAKVLSSTKQSATADNGEVAATVNEALAYVTETNEAIRIAAHPPTELATSFVLSSASNVPASVIGLEMKVTPRSFQQPSDIIPPQSVFALPLGISVNSPRNLPLATSIYGELPFAASIQSNPGF